MAITVLKKRQKKALAIAFLTLAFAGLIIPVTVHYTIDFIKSFTKEVVVWKIANETDVNVIFVYYNSSDNQFADTITGTYDSSEDLLVFYIGSYSDLDSSKVEDIRIRLLENSTELTYEWLLENDVSEIKVHIETDFNISTAQVIIWDIGDPCKNRWSKDVNGSVIDVTFELDLPTLLTAKSEATKFQISLVDKIDSSETLTEHTYLIQIKLVKHEAIDYELYKNILIGGSGILMFFAGVFALPNVSLAEFDRLLRRKRARRGMAGSVLALALVGLTIAIVYYLSGSILMTIMGFFVGVLGYYAFASGRKLSGSKAGATGWLGSMFGAVCDHFTQMQNTIISGVQQGDIACIMWLIGYVWLLLVLLYNFVTTGRVWR